tara:strand:- start:502 stop:1731 length:1230 start_codon:yes stop_codon:yes gene_type:complete
MVHKELDKYRYAVLCCHRRFGKTVMVLNHLIRAALTNKNHNPRLAYIAPTYKQAKSIAWDYLKYYTKNIPGTKYNESELRCDFVNGARITLLSSENFDSIRGIYLDMVAIDEVAQVSQGLIDEVVTPALSDRRGKMFLIGTPKSMNNIFYDYYLKAQSDDKWFLYKAKASDTKIVEQDELDAALAIMGEAKYNQEYECSFTGNVVGSIYGDLVDDLDEAKRIGGVPYNPAHLVHTAWDLGYTDATAIIFFQLINHNIHIIDCYENEKEALPHYAEYLKEKEYIYGNHYAPHDIEQTDFSSGYTRREVANNYGIRFRVSPRIPLEDGIHAVKMILPRCKINSDNCSDLLIALRHYHRKYNDKERVYKLKPVHDFSSHINDALRCLATGIQEETITNKDRQLVADGSYRIL